MQPPENISPELRKEFLRLGQYIGQEDAYAGDDTLGIWDVLRAHFCLADYFYKKGEGIGGLGPRDANLLHSALSRQQAPFYKGNRWSSKFDVVSTLYFGLVKNHAFFDANKRTAFLTCVIHLRKIGRKLSVAQKKFEDLTVSVSEKSYGQFPEFEKFKNQTDDEVAFISYYLKKNSHFIDQNEKSITFQELERILANFGYEFGRPKGNYIDIIRVQRRGPSDEDKALGQKVATIPFPGWSDTIIKNQLRKIRKNLFLTPSNGVDHDDFFAGHDPIPSQISYYRYALERLAYR
jgi:death-on-curing protein